MKKARGGLAAQQEINIHQSNMYFLISIDESILIRVCVEWKAFATWVT